MARVRYIKYNVKKFLSELHALELKHKMGLAFGYEGDVVLTDSPEMGTIASDWLKTRTKDLQEWIDDLGNEEIMVKSKGVPNARH